MVKDLLSNGKINVLWGAGGEGRRTLFDFISQGIYVGFFCDSDPDKQGLRLFNKKVLSTEKVLKNPDNYNVVIATNIERNVLGIEEKLLESGYQGEVIYAKDLVRGFGNLDISWDNIYLITRSRYKKIIIYGVSPSSAEISYILSYLDLDTAYFVDENVADEYMFQHRPVKSVYSLLDEKEDSFLVILPEKDLIHGYQMKQLGMICEKDFIFWKLYYSNSAFRKLALDPSLGFSFETEGQKVPGITVFGDLNAKLKIATLGGSTTDSGLSYFPSWSELLAEKLIAMGMDACVICAGCVSYQSSQEFIKLVRDILPMYPDIVISYTGYNDACHDNMEYPFLHPYQITFLQSISGETKEVLPSMNPWNDEQNYVLGIQNGFSIWDEFEKNIQCMGAVCKERGIKYYAFLQPCMAIKEMEGNLTISEREWILSMDIGTRRKEAFQDFYSHRGKSSLLTDMTGIFDHYDVYLDWCHVTEEGNRIIANAILEELKKKGEIIV